MASIHKNISQLLTLLEITNMHYIPFAKQKIPFDEDSKTINEAYSRKIEKAMSNPIQRLNDLNIALKRLTSAVRRVMNDSDAPSVNMSTFDSTNVDINQTYLSTMDTVFYDYVIPIIVVIGLISNIFGICFLSTGTRRGKTNSLLLLSFVTFNILFLLLEAIKSVEFFELLGASRYRATYQIILISAIRFSKIASFFMLISHSRFRLSAIKEPIRYVNRTRSGIGRRNSWLKSFVPVTIISVLLTLPILFEFEFDYEDNDDEKVQILLPSSLRLHPIYSIIYVGGLNVVILGVLPMIYLLYIAHQLKCQMRKRNRTIDYMIVHSTSAIIQKSLTFSMLQKVREEQKTMENDIRLLSKLKDEIKTTGSTARAIFFFVAFNVFRIITTCGEFYVLFDSNKDDESIKRGNGVPLWVDIMALLSELCSVINSSLVPVIYLDLKTRDLKTSFLSIKILVLNRFSSERNSLPSEAQTNQHQDSKTNEAHQNIELTNVDGGITYQVLRKARSFTLRSSEILKHKLRRRHTFPIQNLNTMDP